VSSVPNHRAIRATSPAVVDARGTLWVRPEIVVDVRALGGVTAAGRLRQPSYQGVRPALAPRDLTDRDRRRETDS